MDLSNVTFNSNHKLEAAAKDATTGLRLMLFAFLASVAAVGFAIAAAMPDIPGPWGWVGTALSVAAFVAGAYGSYLTATALDLSGFITGVIVLGVLIPYLRFICLIVLLALAVNLIHKAGYRVTLFGPVGKKKQA